MKNVQIAIIGILIATVAFVWVFDIKGCSFGIGGDYLPPVSGLESWVVESDAYLMGYDSGFESIQVSGNSMTPLIWDGQFVLYDKNGWDHAVRGSIILFRQDGILYIYQVRRKSDTHIEVRGTSDLPRHILPVTRENYVGTVRAIILN